MHYSIPGLEGYFGGKGSAGVHQQIINIIPPHDVFGSFFLGHDYILRSIKPAKRTFACELNPQVYEAWRKALPGVIQHFNYFETLDYRGKNQFELNNTCGITMLENLVSRKAQKKTVFYLDPPYPHDTRLSNHRYLFEMTVNQHIRMLKAAKLVDAYVLISSYENELYNEYLKDWNTKQFPSMTRSGKTAMETVYFNYDLPTELHDYRYFGNDYKEREHYKLKAQRLTRKFKDMTALERNYYSSILKSKGVIS